MTIKPGDFEHPETPKSFREFYMIYFRDSQRLNEKLDNLDANQQDDREALEAVIDKWQDALSKQASCIDSLDLRLKVAEGLVKESHDDIKSINSKTNWFAGVNATLAIIGTAIASMFKGN